MTKLGEYPNLWMFFCAKILVTKSRFSSEIGINSS
jgi:hypothetical protein